MEQQSTSGGAVRSDFDPTTGIPASRPGGNLRGVHRPRNSSFGWMRDCMQIRFHEAGNRFVFCQKARYSLVSGSEPDKVRPHSRGYLEARNDPHSFGLTKSISFLISLDQ